MVGDFCLERGDVRKEGTPRNGERRVAMQNRIFCSNFNYVFNGGKNVLGGN